MARVLIPMGNGFEEIEAVTVIDVLRRAGVEVIVAGLTPGEVTGSRKVRIVPDALLDEVSAENFDMIILPGGQPGVDNLRKSRKVLTILQEMKKSKKKIAAICAAPLVLRDAGLTQGVKLTSYPGFERDLPGTNYMTDRVVEDGDLLTSRGPGTAMEFALKIVERLCGAKKAAKLSGDLLAVK